MNMNNPSGLKIIMVDLVETKAFNYRCSFCSRGFSNAQALGGHMNVHRKDRARINQLISSQNLLSLNMKQISKDSADCNPAKSSCADQKHLRLLTDDNVKKLVLQDDHQEKLIAEEPSSVGSGEERKLMEVLRYDQELDLELRLGPGHDPLV